MPQHSSADKGVIAHFAKDSASWWNESGPFSPLHRMNPARLDFIRAEITAHFGHRDGTRTPLSGLNILDIGCGGGLVCEPLARLGASVTGIDADAEAITAAKTHAQMQDLTIDYRAALPEDVNDSFDVVLALEVIEHVPDQQGFMQLCAKRLKKGGLLIASTLNRTPLSYLVGIVGAEYVTRIVPRGTHQWNAFVKPSEMAAMGRKAQLDPKSVKGLYFNALKSDFEVSDKHLAVNYIMSLQALDAAQK